MEINKKLNRILEERNINVNSLAKGADVPVSNIYKILHGKNKNPGIYTIKKIANYLEVSIDSLVED